MFLLYFRLEMKNLYTYDSTHKIRFVGFVHLHYQLKSKQITMKKMLVVVFLVIFITACGGDNSKNASTKSDVASSETSNPSYDPNRGEGKFKTVDISGSLDAAMAENGSKIYLVKCGACHKVTEEKLVGPGWKGVTSRHQAPWILNFITNTDEMINKDPKAQAQLEICLVRMPNQNLADSDARALLEFMRKNDGVK
jgi:cytochrome c551/c552